MREGQTLSVAGAVSTAQDLLTDIPLYPQSNALWKTREAIAGVTKWLKLTEDLVRVGGFDVVVTCQDCHRLTVRQLRVHLPEKLRTREETVDDDGNDVVDVIEWVCQDCAHAYAMNPCENCETWYPYDEMVTGEDVCLCPHCAGED